MAYYETQKVGKGQYQTVHIASNCIVLPLGILNTCLKSEAEIWRKRCETAAPTLDPARAAKLLIEANIPQDWRRRAMALVGM